MVAAEIIIQVMQSIFMAFILNWLMSLFVLSASIVTDNINLLSLNITNNKISILCGNHSG